MTGPALIAVGGRVTNPSTTITVLTENTGDSFTVRNFDAGTLAYIVGGWGLGATAGIQQIHSPRMHDDTRGIRTKLLAANSMPPYAIGGRQLLYPQDKLVFEQSGGAAETDSGCMLQWFSSLGGTDGRFIDWNQAQQRSVNYLTVETTHTSGAVLGDWSGSVALNSGSQLLKANVDYAVLGYAVDTMVTSVGIKGTDTGNYRAAGPGSTDRLRTSDWYANLSRLTGLPTIPVINAANVGGTFVDIQHNANAVTVVVEHILLQLG